jgi:hypothetical protein
MVGRDRRARRSVHNAKSFCTTGRCGCAQKTKSFSSRCVANHAAKISSAIQTLRAPFLIPLNSEIKTMFGMRGSSV